MCNHPKLFSSDVPDASHAEGMSNEAMATILRSTRASALAEAEENGTSSSSSSSSSSSNKRGRGASEARMATTTFASDMSGKLAVVEELLDAIHTQTPDRVVICSSFTSTVRLKFHPPTYLPIIKRRQRTTHPPTHPP